MVVRFNNAGTRIAGINNYFDSHLVWDEFFDIDRATKRNWNMARIPAAIQDAFAKGKLKGSACKKIAARYFERGVEIDNQGPTKAGFFKKYAQLSGLCDYYKKAYGFAMHNLKTSMYFKGSNIVQVLKYTPGKAGGKKASKPVTQWNIYRFSHDGSKCEGWNSFYLDPKPWNEVTGSRTSTKKTWSMRVLGWALKRFKWRSFKRARSCKWRVRRYFARWVQVDNTRNGVKDDYFKQYSRGFNGLCEWFGKSYPRICLVSQKTCTGEEI